MNFSFLIRTLAISIPLITIIVIALIKPPSSKQWFGAILATIWNAVILYPLQILAITMDWWQFDAQGSLLFGVPVDLWLGWSFFWGMMLPLAFRKISPWIIVLVAFWLDLILMPQTQPLIGLGSGWLWGEFFCVVFALTPGFFLARWTQNQTHLRMRVCLQVIGFSGLVFGIFPLALYGYSYDNSHLSHPSYLLLFDVFDLILNQFSSPLGLILMPFIILFMIIGLLAVKEFVIQGHGSPIPFDPPQKLVTTGIYGYLANPMQVSSSMIMFLLAFILQHPLFYIYAFMSFIFSIGFYWCIC